MKWLEVVRESPVIFREGSSMPSKHSLKQSYDSSGNLYLLGCCCWIGLLILLSICFRISDHLSNSRLQKYQHDWYCLYFTTLRVWEKSWINLYNIYWGLLYTYSLRYNFRLRTRSSCIWHQMIHERNRVYWLPWRDSNSFSAWDQNITDGPRVTDLVRIF